MTSPFPSPPMEFWQWIYLAAILMAGLRFFAAGMVPILGQGIKLSAPWSIPVALGLLSLHPYAWGVAFGPLVLLAKPNVPTGAWLVAAGFTLASFVAIPVALAEPLFRGRINA